MKLIHIDSLHLKTLLWNQSMKLYRTLIWTSLTAERLQPHPCEVQNNDIFYDFPGNHLPIQIFIDLQSLKWIAHSQRTHDLSLKLREQDERKRTSNFMWILICFIWWEKIHTWSFLSILVIFSIQTSLKCCMINYKGNLMIFLHNLKFIQNWSFSQFFERQDLCLLSEFGEYMITISIWVNIWNK